MPDRVDQYLDAFSSAILFPDDSQEEAEALLKMDALWSMMSEQERDAIREVLANRIRSLPQQAISALRSDRPN